METPADLFGFLRDRGTLVKRLVLAEVLGPPKGVRRPPSPRPPSPRPSAALRERAQR
ncbi:MAG: hypothetical protein HYZ28_10220 [Myxococcales bacterium]|nr:hypothetical protein [Myxococcales bacterium]